MSSCRHPARLRWDIFRDGRKTTAKGEGRKGEVSPRPLPRRFPQAPLPARPTICPWVSEDVPSHARFVQRLIRKRTVSTDFCVTERHRAITRAEKPFFPLWKIFPKAGEKESQGPRVAYLRKGTRDYPAPKPELTPVS